MKANFFFFFLLNESKPNYQYKREILLKSKDLNTFLKVR